MQTRISHLLCVGAAFACFRLAAGEELPVRQVIIRAPEASVVVAALANPDDDALAALLRQWVKDGKAEVVSDLKGALSSTSPAYVKSGRDFDWVVENDQEFGTENSDVALLTPSAFQKVFIGSSLGAEVLHPDANAQRPFIEASWKTFFSPCDERTVPWSYWWPETTKQPKVSWYGQKDFFVEEVTTSARLAAGHTTVIGIMRRANHHDLALKGEKTLDVILGQVSPAPSHTQVPPDFQKVLPHSPHGRCTVLGFGMKDVEALKLLSGNRAPRGKALLDALLESVAKGQVELQLFTSMAAFQGSRSNLRSVREHSYPTEMPTIPSAWNTRDTGTLLEIDSDHHFVNLALEFHPAPPRRAEWRCALETPDLFMWQPQFFVRRMKTGIDFGDEGVALLGAMRTPECQQGAKGITPGETLILMARLDGMTVLPEDRAGKATRDLPQLAVVEVEAVVFDIPAAERADWSGRGEGLADDAGFATLLERSMGRDVKLAAQVVVATVAGQRSEAKSVEEVKAVTEVDPPAEVSPSRYRPTALETIPCGTKCEVNVTLYRPDNPLRAVAPLEVYVDYALSHDVAPLREADYETMIAVTRNNGGSFVPEFILFREHWQSQATLAPGKAHFIGMREPPGDALKDRLHVAFLRTRVKEGRGAQPDSTPIDPFAPNAERK
jgi:hypothetical protein